MFSARRRARATPAAAIPRRPAAAAAAPPRAGGRRLAPQRPLGGGPAVWSPRPACRAAGRGGVGVWCGGGACVGGSGSLYSAHKMEGASAAGDLLRQEPAPWRPLPPPPLRRRRPRLASLARPHGGRERGRHGDGAPRRGGTGAAVGRVLCPGLRAAAGIGDCLPPAGSCSPGGRLSGMCLPPTGCEPSREHKTFTAFPLITGVFSLLPPPPAGLLGDF